MAALSGAYLYACGYRLDRSRNHPVCTASQLRLFWLSQVVLGVALMSPLDYLGDNFLFSAHMIQHLVLASVWPALLLLSIPEELGARAFRNPRLSRVIGWTALPAVALVVYNVDLSIWHIPSWYDLTLTNDNVHILEHLTFMAAGLIVWWPVVGPVRRLRLSYGASELYLFANLFPMMALGVFFSFWQHPIYTPYIHDPRIWGISALTDQQIGGLIMWMPGNIPFALAMLIIGVTWLEKGDPRERAPLTAPVPDVAP